MKRLFYDCPNCRHTWAIRVPLEELTNPFAECARCGTKSPPKQSQAWENSFCDECGAGADLTVTMHGRLCNSCLSKPEHVGKV